MNARRINSAADLICRTMQTHQTPAGIAMALDAAGMLQSPETAAEAERLRDRVAELEALDLGAVDGRRSASCGKPDHPTWLRKLDDTRACPWCVMDLQNASLVARTHELVHYQEMERNRWANQRMDESLAAVANRRIAELNQERDGLRARVAELEQQTADVSPWQRAVDGLNALVDAGIGFHVEPDGHISNPSGGEHIEWDRAAERWRLVHDDDPGPTPAESAARLRGILAPSTSGSERRKCGALDDYGRACDFRPHATGDHGRSDGLDLITWPAVAAPAGPPEPHSCGICGVSEQGVHGLRPSPGGGTHRWTDPTGEQVQARMRDRAATARAAGGERP
ncbi:hypothetical protein ACF082_30040 [Streptomyces lydicus]|uniref:hypothetical protein n=1 Tax=Streptomyces lydicus TaxID=47763 RepID=UPI0036F56F2B